MLRIIGLNLQCILIVLVCNFIKLKYEIKILFIKILIKSNIYMQKNSLKEIYLIKRNWFGLY